MSNKNDQLEAAMAGVENNGMLGSSVFEIGTPNNIDVLLHCHVSPCVHERYDAPAVKEAVKMLWDAGAIEPDPNRGLRHWQTTDLGKAWVDALCRVPTPRTVYMDHAGNILNA